MYIYVCVCACVHECVWCIHVCLCACNYFQHLTFLFQTTEAVFIDAEEAKKYGVEIPAEEEFKWGKQDIGTVLSNRKKYNNPYYATL